MKENDPLDSVLREWEAPQPSSALDARVYAGYRALHRASPWRRIWSARVTIRVPVLAALLLIAAVVWLRFHSASSGFGRVPPPTTVAVPDGTYATQLQAAGFEFLPNGETRIIRAGVKQ